MLSSWTCQRPSCCHVELEHKTTWKRGGDGEILTLGDTSGWFEYIWVSDSVSCNERFTISAPSSNVSLQSDVYLFLASGVYDLSESFPLTCHNSWKHQPSNLACFSVIVFVPSTPRLWCVGQESLRALFSTRPQSREQGQPFSDLSQASLSFFPVLLLWQKTHASSHIIIPSPHCIVKHCFRTGKKRRWERTKQMCVPSKSRQILALPGSRMVILPLTHSSQHSPLCAPVSVLWYPRGQRAVVNGWHFLPWLYPLSS